MVQPTNLKPRCFKSLLMASDSGVVAGTSLIEAHAFCFCLLPTNPQMYSSNVPNSSCTARNIFAFWIAASIFNRLRTIPASDSKLFRFFLAVLADTGGIEQVERCTIVLSLVQNRLPTQARLRSFKDQELEQESVVMDRHTPFGVVILHIQVSLRPRATVHLSPPLA